MVERAQVRGFSGLNWLLFDLVFKPAAVCAVVVLERWFSYRVKLISTRGALKIAAMDTAARRHVGPTTAHIVCAKFIRLIVHFCETDNAYGLVFEDFIVEYNKNLREAGFNEQGPVERKKR